MGNPQVVGVVAHALAGVVAVEPALQDGLVHRGDGQARLHGAMLLPAAMVWAVGGFDETLDRGESMDLVHLSLIHI